MGAMVGKICFFLYVICSLLIASSTATQENRKRYIVYMGELPKDELFTSSHRHSRMLQEVVGSKFSPSHLKHSFKRSFDGFVAKLTENEAKKMAGMPNVVSVFPSKSRTLDTTRSWEFMGFSQQVKRTNLESDIIVGMLDSGIWPESESFGDEGFGPPPSKWKGTCQTSSDFSCNNKIIGARYYRENGNFSPLDAISPRDIEGHGTHTASTAAGNLVSMASLYGLASGTARGGVPSARIAVYKICWIKKCKDEDILKAFDDAIADGVDIVSLSVGGKELQDYFTDTIAIGAYHAMRKGIFVSASAGNRGPDSESIRNFAPWLLSVASGTTDRKFIAKVQLGNSKIFEGVAINTFDLNQTMYPMIYGGDAPNISGGSTSDESRFCKNNSLDENLVKGKIVICDAKFDGETPFLDGATGLIMRGQRPRDRADTYPLPASYIGDLDKYDDIVSYIKFTSDATATIYESTEEINTLARVVAYSSSRGPNPISPDILKPDISAPGVDILAAWSQGTSVTRIQGDNRIVPYNILSGTSMACPHATGVAAYVKSHHPTWSPSAIKSAIMTTALPMSPQANSDAEFAYGAGFLNPSKSIDPGFVYDAEPIDYIKFLCGQGYNTSMLRDVTRDYSTCSETINGTAWDLNYPSFAVPIKQSEELVSRTLNRTVTNVGLAISTYKATVTAPVGLDIQVNPNILEFTSLGQKLSFAVTVEGKINGPLASASLVWDDGVHQVRSPIVVFKKN